MIVTRLIGGLGNQLFQYSYGKRLAVENNCDLCLDTSAFETYKLHHYALNHFRIEQNFVDQETRSYVANAGFWERVTNRRLRIVREKDYRFRKRYIIKGDFDVVFLDGYWQSFKYFEPIADEIRKSLELTSALTVEDDKVLAAIRSADSVASLHVRRTDYVTNASALHIHGVCTLEYYKAASRLLRKLRNIKTFVVFSDDTEWARKHLDIEGELIFCRHNGPDRNFADLYLMSCCSSHIVANSSFSWWGAWINPRLDKAVVAPAQWYADRKKNAQTADLIPLSWHRI